MLNGSKRKFEKEIIILPQNKTQRKIVDDEVFFKVLLKYRMNDIDLTSLLDSEIFKQEDFQPDFSNSSLRDYDKRRLVDKIKQMHCESLLRMHYEVFIALLRTDFDDLFLANRIYLSTVKGNNLTEIFKQIDIDSQKWESNIIVNFVFKKGIELSELETIFEKMNAFSQFLQFKWGVAINPNSSDNYFFELITYS